jgi:hypothetical protein
MRKRDMPKIREMEVRLKEKKKKRRCGCVGCQQRRGK